MNFDLGRLFGSMGPMDLDSLVEILGNRMQQQPQICPNCTACATKDGRTIKLQEVSQDQKNFMESIQSNVQTLGKQIAAYELALKDADPEIKEKLQKAQAKIRGEYAGYMDFTSRLAATMQKIEDMVSMIAGFNNKEALSQEEMNSLSNQVIAFNECVQTVDQIKKTQLDLIRKEKDEFNAREDKDPNSIPLFEKSKLCEVKSFKATFKDAQEKLQNASNFFMHCRTAIEKTMNNSITAVQIPISEASSDSVTTIDSSSTTDSSQVKKQKLSASDKTDDNSSESDDTVNF